MAEHANKKTKAYMASKGTKLCSTPKYMHYLADAFLELFTIPALYRDAVDSRGRKRIPTRKSRKSDDTLGSAAVCSARALEQAELTPPPAPLRSRSSSVVPTVGGFDFTMSVPTSRTRRPPGKLLMSPPPPCPTSHSPVDAPSKQPTLPTLCAILPPPHTPNTHHHHHHHHRRCHAIRFPPHSISPFTSLSPPNLPFHRPLPTSPLPTNLPPP
jgi:hypothetical protein